MEIFNRKTKALFRYFLVCALLLSICVDSSSNVRDSLQYSYTSQIGVRELTGNNDGVEVESYLSTCGLSKGYAWCAAFVNWNFEQVGIETAVQKAAWAPSWFVDSSKVVYRKTWTRQEYRVLHGQVFGLYFSAKGRVAHLGFIDSENKTSYFTIEGNTNGAGSREGDGVYRKIRSKNSIYIIADYVREERKKRISDWRTGNIYSRKKSIGVESGGRGFGKWNWLYNKGFTPFYN